MLTAILAFFLKLLGGSFTGKVLDAINKHSDNETEKFRVQQITEQNNANNQADVIKTGMGHKMFWVAWSVAALPLSFWFGWGVLDSAINNGHTLPDVAKLPPQLLAYANIVWQNIFYTGAAVGSAEVIAKSVTGIFGRKR